MFIVIQHQVSNWKGFMDAGDKMMKQVPTGLKGHAFYPSTDEKRAFCLWEAPSVNALSAFIDRNLGQFAKNEYFQINERDALGMPQATREAHPTP